MDDGILVLGVSDEKVDEKEEYVRKYLISVVKIFRPEHAEDLRILKYALASDNPREVFEEHFGFYNNRKDKIIFPPYWLIDIQLKVTKYFLDFVTETDVPE